MVARIAIIVFIALCVVGCSAGGPSANAVGDDQAVGSTTSHYYSHQNEEAEEPVTSVDGSDQPETDGLEMSSDEQLRLRMQAGFGGLDGEQFETYAADYRQSKNDQEEFIQACMTDRGFEYFLTSLGSMVWRPGYEVPVGTKAWVDRYGFGITTTALPAELVEPHAVGYVGPPPKAPDISEASDESRYLNSLDRPTYRAYTIALDGWDPDSERDDSEHDPEDAATLEMVADSCRSLAQQKHPEPYAPQPGDAELTERVLASSDWADYERSSRRCLAENDVDLWSELDVAKYLDGRMAGLDVGHAMESDHPTEPSDDALERLADLQDDELRLASLFWKCGAHPAQQGDRFVELASTVAAEDA